MKNMAHEASIPTPPVAAEAVSSAAFGPPGRFGGTFRALRNRNYRLYYFSQMISLSGTWMQSIAQAWLVLQITNSKIALGTVTMLQFLPITIFVLFAGVIADRVPKRPFIFCTQALAMAQALALTVLVWSGHVQLWHVYLLAAALGLANAFEQPARQAFAVELVGKDHLINAIALNSGMFNAARLVGPGIGGFIIATAGVKVAFLFNAISFIPVIIALALMNSAEFHTDPQPRERANPISELREGLAYAFRTPSVLLIVILLVFVGTFGYNFTVMLPLVDRYVLHYGPGGLGLLTGALALGAVISALFIAGREGATKRMIFIGGSCFAALIGAVAVSQWFVLTLLLLLLTGIASTAFQATTNTSMQLTAPDHLRGRVMSLYMLLFAGSTPFGAYFTGQMAEHLGVPAAVGICAALTMLGIAAGALYYVTHRSQIPAVAGGPIPA
jgi:MFS family permease